MEYGPRSLLTRELRRSEAYLAEAKGFQHTGRFGLERFQAGSSAARLSVFESPFLESFNANDIGAGASAGMPSVKKKKNGNSRCTDEKGIDLEHRH